mmetsp:Transcript_30667/g.88944  ORF Transcript_30667/g.88944 Transcript_30667/m.88944 type:complete len:361 (+) Transcript_30667:104-1186(+)
MPRVPRVNNAVVPQSRRGVVGRALLLVLVQGRSPEFLQLLSRHLGLALPLQLLLLHGGKHVGRLCSTHDADPGVRPHEQKPGVVGSAAHAIVARAVASGDNNGDLGHICARHRVDHFRAVPRDAALLICLADHEACDVLQKQQGHTALVAQLHEVGALLRGFAEEDAVVRDDADGVAVDVRETADQRGAITRLELVQPGTVHDAGDDLAGVEGLRVVLGDEPEELRRVVQGRLGLEFRAAGGRHLAHMRQDLPAEAQGGGLVLGEVVGDARARGVDVGAAQLLRRDLLARGGLHQRRAAQEDSAVALDDDVLVGHRRDVGPAGGARAEHRGDLGDASGGHRRLVVEDPPEVHPVGEDLVL